MVTAVVVNACVVYGAHVAAIVRLHEFLVSLQVCAIGHVALSPLPDQQECDNSDDNESHQEHYEPEYGKVDLIVVSWCWIDWYWLWTWAWCRWDRSRARRHDIAPGGDAFDSVDAWSQSHFALINIK